jgi:photosystem II stability/assembly factor-like uncharacterized protein
MLFILNNEKTDEEKRLAYVEYINNHPYSKRKLLTKEELKKIPKKDRPDLAFEQDFLRTMDPATRSIPKGRLVAAINTANEMTAASRNTNFSWTSRGPREVGGRIRALFFDPNDNTDKKVFAGGVGGGIWMNNDITDAASTWTQVAPNMTNFAISAMAYDPVNTMTFYAGTGEGWGNVDAINGGGIWKSTDGGATWANLASTTDFEFVYDLIVRNEGGTAVIYASMRDSQNVSSAGTDLFRSTNGGTTWTNVSGNAIRDLEIAADNTIWAGDASGKIYSSTDGTTWTEKYTGLVANPSRVEIATAPSDSDVIYALIANGSAFGEFVKSTDGGTNWTSFAGPEDSNDASIPPTDFTRGQAWYDLIAAVNPGNADEVFVGGVNAFKTTDGGTSWIKISSWSDSRDASVSFVHADHHNIVFRPNHNDQMAMANDGGIFFVPDLSAVPTSGINAYTTGIFPRNLNLNVTQFYSAAIDPVNTNGFIGGTQDNGTQLFSDAGFGGTTEIWGGDGGFSFIDQTIDDGTDGQYRIVSFTGNTYYLLDYTDTPRSWVRLNSGSGSFINPADYDDVNNILYSHEATGSVTETTLNADNVDQGAGNSGFLGSTQNLSIPELTSAVTHVRVSPYNEGNRAVFFGTSGNRLIKRTADGTVTNISNTFVISGAVSCLEIGADDDELLLTYSNYGVESVWYSTNGGTTWVSKEGNLPDMPVRWALFNPLDRKEVLLATEVGMWRTLDITAGSVVWEPVSTNMGNVRVDMLQYRDSDNLVLAATHGRGMFTSTFTATPASVNEVQADKKAFTMYPTISKGDFTLYAKNTLGKSNLYLFDISGKQVHTATVDFNQNSSQQISVNLRPGVYIVNLIDENNKKSSGKVIIE